MGTYQNCVLDSTLLTGWRVQDLVLICTFEVISELLI